MINYDESKIFSFIGHENDNLNAIRYKNVTFEIDRITKLYLENRLKVKGVDMQGAGFSCNAYTFKFDYDSIMFVKMINISDAFSIKPYDICDLEKIDYLDDKWSNVGIVIMKIKLLGYTTARIKYANAEISFATDQVTVTFNKNKRLKNIKNN